MAQKPDKNENEQKEFRKKAEREEKEFSFMEIWCAFQVRRLLHL
jgi:hypothetical protein